MLEVFLCVMYLLIRLENKMAPQINLNIQCKYDTDLAYKTNVQKSLIDVTVAQDSRPKSFWRKYFNIPQDYVGLIPSVFVG